MKLYRVLVCGGRNYIDRARVFAELDAIAADHEEISILHGACCDPDDPTELWGADRWAQQWAQTRQCFYGGFPARWRREGRSAGPKRNRRMALFRPDLVLAFPGGRGTQDMIDVAREFGLQVREIEP